MRRAAEATPAHRDRYVDLLRAVAIAAVVTGHWLVVHVTDEGGGLSGVSVLDVAAWTRPLTWLFQVMPLFFLVGGYANAASLTSYLRRGGSAAGWTLRRTDRLVRPTTTLLVVLAAAALAARAAGVDPRLAGLGVWLAGIPLWFLVAYLAGVVLTPATYGLHRRFGLAVPVVLAALVGGRPGPVRAGGAVAGGGELPVRLARRAPARHRLAGGALPDRPGVAAPLALLGLAALAGLTVAGPYPVSMVQAAGTEIQNTAPPTLALLALAVTQTGLALLCHRAGNRWLRRPRPWTAVVAVNSVIMTMYLWHMTAVVLGALALHAAGLLPHAAPGTAAWVALRLPWLAVLAGFLAVLVALFGRIERRSGPVPEPGAASGPAAAAATLAGVAGVIGGLLGIAVAGPGDHGPAGMPTVGLLGYLAGAAVLRYARRRSAAEARSAARDAG